MNTLKATGVIVEYNPFHNGHKLHAQAARTETNADIVIAIMSGNFLQRGEPAFVDKWLRTEMALQNGVDLVFELPYAFSTAHAPQFARGAIQLLDASQCHAYCFGSEEGQIQPFTNSMTLLHTHHTNYEQAIKKSIANGISYPQALQIAYNQLIDHNPNDGPFTDLTKPNNILGFHYVQAAHTIKSTMKPTTIGRVGANYHDEQLHNHHIGSATAIRKNVLDTNSLATVANFVPETVYKLLHAYEEKGRSFGNWDTFYPFLRLLILRDQPKRLARIADVTEGIENLMYRSALQHDDFDGFMNAVKSKRYTWTRIQRMLTHILTGYTSSQRAMIESPSYLRLLGMNKDGRRYLNQYKNDFKLPLVSKVSAFSNDTLDLEIHTTNMYALGMNEPSLINADYKKAPIFIRK